MKIIHGRRTNRSLSDWINAKQIVRIGQGAKGIVIDFPSGSAIEYDRVDVYVYNAYGSSVDSQVTPYYSAEALAKALGGWFGDDNEP